MTELVRALSVKIDKMEKYVDKVLPLVKETFKLKDDLKINAKKEVSHSHKKIGTGVAEKQSEKVWKEKQIAL